MRDFGDLNKLIELARYQGVSVELSYSESSDEMSVEIISAAEGEKYYQKRILDVNRFIEQWEKHLDSKESK